MTIYDLMEMFVDSSFQQVYVWDVRTEREIWRGDYSDIPEELAYMEICSIDNITGGEAEYIGFNVETEE